MSHARLKYGIEYDPLREKRDDPSGTGWIVVVVLIVVAASFVTTLVGRIGSSREESAKADDSIVVAELQDAGWDARADEQRRRIGTDWGAFYN